MPHRNSARSFHNRYTPLGAMASTPVITSGLSEVSGDARSLSLSSASITTKHNRRNTEPIQLRPMRSTSCTTTTTTSWGSMFDFSSIFFPVKKSKPRGGHSVQADNSNFYHFPIDHTVVSNSPSTTTGSCSGYEDSDNSHSSDCSGTHRTGSESTTDISVHNNGGRVKESVGPILPLKAGHDSAGKGGSDVLTARTFVATKTDVIADRWISMATTSFPESLSPLHAHDQYYCKSDINCNEATVALSCDLTYSDDSDHCPYEHYSIMMDRPCDVSDTVTSRYTNDYRNFQYGTQIASMEQNVRAPISEQFNSSPSTNEQPCTSSGMQGDYTTKQSHSSRGYDQFNEGDSSSSIQQATASGGGGSPHRDGTSNGAMSDDEDAYQSSDDDDNESLSDTEDIEEEEKLRKEATSWKTAVDPKSGRTYYYNTKTLETQWRKPLCCATRSERRAAIKKEKQTLAFFASMEQNILRTIQQQQHPSITGPSQRHHSMVETSPRKLNGLKEAGATPHRRESEPPTSLQNPFKLIRTISSMEDTVLAALVQRVPSFRHSATSSKRNITGNGAAFSSYSRRHITVDASVHNDSSDGDHNENSDENVQRLVAREDSLPFGAIIDATRSQRRIGLDTNERSSFNFSTLMRMNSVNDSRLNMFEYIPEGENEDNSESCSNHFENSEISSSSRGNKSLIRQGGFINLNKSECFLSSKDMNENDNENEDEDEIDDPTNQVSYRDSLRRMNGSLALRVESANNSKEPITRENSLNLTEITGGRQMMRDPSVALKDVGHWDSYLSESALRGLSIDESEAMLELASITDRMGGIHSDSSDSSEDSVDDTKISTELGESGNNTENERNGINSSGDLGYTATPELFADKPPRRQSNIISRPSMIRPTSLRNAAAVTVVESASLKPNSMEKPSILRRNTCGTLYVGSTLSAPDKDATIKCVCAVYRAHILQSTLENEELDERYDVFDDLGSKSDESEQRVLILPSLDDVSVFYRDVFSRAQMESDCIIISLIYVERLIKVTDGALRPRITNWRSILFSCMVMASKVWDDLSMWNADFSHTCPAGVEFQLSRINELEIAVLSSLQYKVKVPASEYAKYYFLLRSMLIKSGLGSDDLKAINPLDVEGAKQLQHISSQYQASVALMSDRQKVAMGRSKTTGGSHQIPAQFSVDGSTFSDSSNSSTPLTSPTSEKKQRSKVGLEHMVQL